ncbi:MAP kinase-interacting serine/threonine-protein kinase 1-like [Aplysia californica]|uniref:MAP kinase-interacting serine/threonine-protein kinase 1-like n=1 Tax=Aplysia californica TaxID=6500 RepID=A0ABM0KB77_APLCA|nr:MAP kinase-interacting serine/threonine-protein kinase 1-like [Aplysia californica]
MLPPTTCDVIPPTTCDVIPSTKCDVMLPSTTCDVIPPTTCDVMLPPTTCDVTPPTTCDVILPTTCDVIPPTTCDVIPPTTCDVTPPTTCYVIPPTTCDVMLPPTTCDVIPPTTRDVIPPTTSDIIPPTTFYVTPPTTCDVIPPTICDVTPPTTTTNNTAGDCARAGVVPTESNKPAPRQSEEQTNGDSFCALLEPTGEELGQGSFGSVSTYRHKETGKEYAVKVMRNCQKKRLRRVLSEIETCRRYKNCENILNFVDFYRTGDTFFLIFDKMEGGDLRAVLESTPAYLSESQASRVTGAVARALLTLHKEGVAHRDLKPNNILCRTPGQLTPLVLCDFGVASQPPSSPPDPSQEDNLTKPALKSAVGCPQYVAPEVAGLLLLPKSGRSTAPYDTSCDMWSLGVLLYELLFHRQPFVGYCAQHAQTSVRNCWDCIQDMFPKICRGDYSIPTDARESLSDAAVDLIRRLLVVDPQGRYSAAQVLKHTFVTSHRDDDDVTTTTDCPTALTRQPLSE